MSSGMNFTSQQMFPKMEQPQFYPEELDAFIPPAPPPQETLLTAIVRETMAQYEVRSQKQQRERAEAKRVQPIYKILDERIVSLEIEPGKFICVGEKTTTQCCNMGCPCPPCVKGDCQSCLMECQ